MIEFISIIVIVFGILQIILFFKIWGMTNDVKELRKHFITERKSQSESQQTDVESASIDYDKRLDKLSIGDEVIIKSTGEKVKIVKEWGNNLVVNTYTGSKSIGKAALSYIASEAENTLSAHPIAHYKGTDKAVYVIRYDENNVYECVSMDGKDTYYLKKEELEF